MQQQKHKYHRHRHPTNNNDNNDTTNHSPAVLGMAVQAIAENSYPGMQAHLVAFTPKELQILVRAASTVLGATIVEDCTK